MSHRSKMNHRTIDLDRRVQEKLEGEFQREFFEAAIEVDPCNLECLIRLGDLYTRQGFYEKGLAIDRRLVGICPSEPTFHYNLACSQALLGRLDEALEALRRAIELGYDDWEHVERDEDLACLRKLDAYERVMAKARGDKS
jgi:tetratricopeptide (TPR) repeat protein